MDTVAVGIVIIAKYAGQITMFSDITVGSLSSLLGCPKFVRSFLVTVSPKVRRISQDRRTQILESFHLPALTLRVVMARAAYGPPARA